MKCEITGRGVQGDYETAIKKCPLSSTHCPTTAFHAAHPDLCGCCEKPSVDPFLLFLFRGLPPNDELSKVDGEYGGEGKVVYGFKSFFVSVEIPDLGTGVGGLV